MPDFYARNNGIVFLCTKFLVEQRIRVGAVSYLNTRPFIWGLEKSGLLDSISLVEDYPSSIATLLQEGELDIALLPVAVIPKINGAHIVSNYCIGAEGAVASVAIFSEVPIEQVDTILLDYQSRTSVALAQILMKEYWNLTPQWKKADNDYISSIQGNTAGVIIGDRALQQIAHFPYVYDLALVWKQHTGLPFVFAAWVANKELPPAFETQFSKALEWGVLHIADFIRLLPAGEHQLHQYFTQNISYPITEAKKKGLELFLQKLTQHTIV